MRMTCRRQWQSDHQPPARWCLAARLTLTGTRRRLGGMYGDRGCKFGMFAVILAALMWPASPAHAETWSYEDDKGDAASVVDVVETALNNNTKGFFTVRIYGKEFVKNETDVFVVYFDSNPGNNGPEFVYGSQIGNIPGDKKHGHALTKIDTWDGPGKAVGCKKMSRSVNFKTDVITLKMPKACIGSPDQVRWGGYTGKVTKVTKKFLYGKWDDFPAEKTLGPIWAGRLVAASAARSPIGVRP